MAGSLPPLLGSDGFGGVRYPAQYGWIRFTPDRRQALRCVSENTWGTSLDDVLPEIQDLPNPGRQ